MALGHRERASPRYSLISKLLHWAIAGLIIVQFVLANLAEWAEESGSTLQRLALLANHKSVGMTILMLAVLRLLWRIGHPPPSPAGMPRWQLRASQGAHWVLYALRFLLPISGWLMSSASAYSVSWFNLFQFPDFLSPDPEWKEVFQGIHETLVWLLVVVAGVHILAALKHHFIDRDDVLRGMSSRLTIGTGICLALLGSVWLGEWGRGGAAESLQGEAERQLVDPVSLQILASTLPLWQIDYERSFIHFIGNQAGASFTGSWDNWAASIHFEGDALELSSFDVSIQTADVTTGDKERDATLAETDWFDPQSYPTAYYRADRFTLYEDGTFVAEGQLIIKGLAAPVQLHFSIEELGGRRILTGNARLFRLAMGVGTGEWADTSWVGDEVSVAVRVEATIDNATP